MLDETSVGRPPNPPDDTRTLIAGSLRIQYRSHYDSQWLQELLRDPDRRMAQPDFTILKPGRPGSATTVGYVEIDRRNIVIKRYDTKNAWHALRRTVRRSRAENCWNFAGRLERLGVTTAPSVAFIQEYVATGLRGCSWYVMEYIDDGLIRLDSLKASAGNAASSMVQIIKMMTRLRDHHISHGDMKATNLLVDETEDRVVLLDLDAMKEHFTVDRARAATAKDVDRFLRNWPEGSVFHKLAREELKRASFTLPD